MIQQNMPFLAVARKPEPASDKAMRMIETEADAIAYSIAKSRIKHIDLASFMTCDQSLISKWISGERSLIGKQKRNFKRIERFCVITGQDALKQWLRIHDRTRDDSLTQRQRLQMQAAHELEQAA